MSTVVVTGASGFVGGHISKFIDVLDISDECGSIDICDEERLYKLFCNYMPKAVIHLAAQSSVAESIHNPRRTLEINLLGTLSLLQALRRANFKGRLLYVSSSEVYGTAANKNEFLSEVHTPEPTSPYALSKFSSEILCKQWSDCSYLDIVIARPFNHIGPGQSEKFAISSFARQISCPHFREDQTSIYVGNIDVYRDFLDVRDVVTAYIALLECGINGEIYNVCSGRSVSLRNIIENLKGISNADLRVISRPNLLRAHDLEYMCGSFEKLNQLTGWAPQISLDSTLIDVVKYWRQKEFYE